MEAAGTVARGRDDAGLGYLFAMSIAGLPGLVLVAADQPLAYEAARIAADRRLRGGDAVYGAVALRFGSVLVTRDREQRDRLAPLLRTKSPEQMLAAMRQ